jgi:CheY-like chemotaxis protein
MRLLLVEDDITFAKVVVRALEKVPGCEVAWAQGRNEALAELNRDYFELVLLDRAIPSAKDVLDGAVDHGWAVFETIRTQQRGPASGS